MSAVLTQLRRIADENQAMLRQAVDNRTPAASGTTTTQTAQTTAQTTTTAWSTRAISFTTVDAMLAQLPVAKYALPSTNGGDVAFFEVHEYKGGKRIRRLYGAPRDWRRETMKLRMQYFAALHIIENLLAAVALFADTHQCCGKCGSPLSNGDSLAAKLGPVCRKAFGL